MIAVLASASAWAEIQAVAGDRRCILARDQDELLRLAGDADAVVLEAKSFVPVLPVVRHINQTTVSWSRPSTGTIGLRTTSSTGSATFRLAYSVNNI